MDQPASAKAVEGQDAACHHCWFHRCCHHWTRLSLHCFKTRIRSEYLSRFRLLRFHRSCTDHARFRNQRARKQHRSNDGNERRSNGVHVHPACRVRHAQRSSRLCAADSSRYAANFRVALQRKLARCTPRSSDAPSLYR